MELTADDFEDLRARAQIPDQRSVDRADGEGNAFGLIIITRIRVYRRHNSWLRLSKFNQEYEDRLASIFKALI
jgi:hypothetical protein